MLLKEILTKPVENSA